MAFWFSNQVLISSHCKVAAVKVIVVIVAETPETGFRQARRTAAEGSKGD
jgi:hypothetical protein